MNDYIWTGKSDEPVVSTGADDPNEVVVQVSNDHDVVVFTATFDDDRPSVLMTFDMIRAEGIASLLRKAADICQQRIYDEGAADGLLMSLKDH